MSIRHVAQSAPQQSLASRRVALLARIHLAREETAEVGRLLATDLHATERTRRSILTAVKVLKASAVAAGVIWTFNATSNIGRGRRFVTLAISLLSTVRAMRKVGLFLSPFTQISQKKGCHHENRNRSQTIVGQ